MDSNQRAQSNIKNISQLNDKTNNNLNGKSEEKDIELYKISDQFYKGKKYLAIKLPGRIENIPKAIEYLGGKESINKKILSKDDLEFSSFLKSINLEKCISNDLILKRKRKRNKITGEVKYKFEVSGKLEYSYEFFSLHDYIFLNKENENISYNLDSLKEKQTGNAKKEKHIENKAQGMTNILNNTAEEIDKFKKLEDESLKILLKEHIDETNKRCDEQCESKYVLPDILSIGRNMYANRMNLLKSEIKIDKIIPEN